MSLLGRLSALALVLSSVLESMLFGTVDAQAFAGASMLMLGIGVLAAVVPAWRAGSVDPALVLRER